LRVCREGKAAQSIDKKRVAEMVASAVDRLRASEVEVEFSETCATYARMGRDELRDLAADVSAMLKGHGEIADAGVVLGQASDGELTAAVAIATWCVALQGDAVLLGPSLYHRVRGLVAGAVPGIRKSDVEVQSGCVPTETDGARPR
jgi:hypothetical protein